MPSHTMASHNAFEQALNDIQAIMDSTHKNATAGEKLVRIGWVFGNLPADIRDTILKEAQSRVGIGWALGRKPTDW